MNERMGAFWGSHLFLLPHARGKTLEQVSEKTAGGTSRLDEIAKRLTALDDRTKELSELDKRIQALRVVSAVNIALIALRSSRAVVMSCSRSSVCFWTSLFLPPAMVLKASSMCVLAPTGKMENGT